MPFQIPAKTLDSSFSISNSCIFYDDAKLTRTFGSGGSVVKWTWSSWFKVSYIGGNEQVFFSSFADANNYSYIKINGNNKLEFRAEASGSDVLRYTLTRRFRDPSAFMHLVVALDTTDGTAGDRIKIWINGVRETVFDASTAPAEDAVTLMNSAAAHAIGYAGDGTDYFQGYMSQVCFVDNVQYDADQFGEFDEDSAIWKPIDVSGLTFGATSFFLDFADSGDLGDDESGEGNDWTEVNLAATDQSTDTPTNNFPTLNPLAIGSFPVLSEGNLNVRANSDAEYGNIIGTFSTSSSGKWYYEIKVIGKTGTSPWVGLIVDDAPKAGIATNGGANSAGSSSFSAPSFVIQSDGQVTQAGSAGTTYTSFAIGDIISFSIDMDNGACYIAKNGTYMNSGNPASAGSKTGAIITWTAGSVSGFLPAVSVYGASTSSGSFSAVSMNFGSPTFAISSSNADGNGYGNFEYAVPSGYFAINTKNLSEASS